jgi:hypothetical protein
MNIYEKRWATVKAYFERINDLIRSDIVVVYDGAYIEKPFFISEQMKEISIREDCSTYIVYSGDPMFDEGVHDKIEDTLAKFRKEFKFLRHVDIMV